MTKELLIAILDDDYGVSVEAYFVIETAVRNNPELMEILSKTDCSEERVFLPDGWDQ